MKRVAIILVLVTIFASLVTATMIIKKQTQYAKKYSLNENEVDNQIIEEEKSLEKVVLYKEYHLPINDNAKGATLSQTLDINPIKFTEHVYEDDRTYAIYLQIDGLANENIEEAINTELKDQIIEFGHFAYDKILEADSGDTYTNFYTNFGKYNKNKHYNYGDKPDNWNSCVNEKILFNGNGVISIAMTDYNDSYLPYYSDVCIKYLNYNLSNGEKIKIEELLTKDYNIIDAFSRKLYHKLAEGEIKWKEKRYYNEITGEEEWWRK